MYSSLVSSYHEVCKTDREREGDIWKRKTLRPQLSYQTDISKNDPLGSSYCICELTLFITAKTDGQMFHAVPKCPRYGN